MARPRLLLDGTHIFVSLMLSFLLAAPVGVQHAWSWPLPVASSPEEKPLSVHAFFDSRGAGGPSSIPRERALHDCHPPHGFVLLPQRNSGCRWLELKNGPFSLTTTSIQ